MDGLDVPQFTEVIGFAPDGEFCGGPSIGSPRVRIPDIGGEEFNEPLGRVPVRSEQGRQLRTSLRRLG
jgi:hypothetical protein